MFLKKSINIMRRWRIEVGGVVQGVGFRPHLYRVATKRQLTGWARNTQSSVEIEIEGEHNDCERFIAELVAGAPPAADIAYVGISEMSADGGELSFTIENSRLTGGLTPIVPADIGICDDCRRELLSADDRRSNYPHINCSHCGPRYTIINDLPYDRERTTMRSFHMCVDCRIEYENELARRFHAEPNACRHCGPRYTYVAEDREVADETAVDLAAKTLADRKIVAIKGIGGFHLACLATDAEVIARLRRAKFRPDKPMAVLVGDLREAQEIADISADEAELLAGPDRPIVVCRARPGRLASNISPGLDTVGIMLPYAPVQILLLKKLKDPIVMTSANQKGEPILIDNRGARTKLKSLADAWLWHNRIIVNGCDDSVVRHNGFQASTLRAGRGRAPIALPLPGKYPPILACGADLKGSICLAAGGWAQVSQYLGDLEDPRCLERLDYTVRRLAKLTRIRPEIVICDNHPDYVSAAFARNLGLPIHLVQHHHAHIVSVMVERGVREAVIGVAFDGSGWGADGTVWGGEWLVCDRREYRRVGRIRPVRMAGGEIAVREPWRMALSYLLAAGLEEPDLYERFQSIDADHLRLAKRQIDHKINAPLTSSAGRLFEAISAITLGCTGQTYEGQAASYLESAAHQSPDGSTYRFEITTTNGDIEVDHAPVFLALLADLGAGISPAEAARKFHNGLAEAIAGVGELIRQRENVNNVVLSGGVFANSLLLSRATALLVQKGFNVFTGEQVPINDGGISLGQAGVAAAGGARVAEVLPS